MPSVGPYVSGQFLLQLLYGSVQCIKILEINVKENKWRQSHQACTIKILRSLLSHSVWSLISGSHQWEVWRVSNTSSSLDDEWATALLHLSHLREKDDIIVWPQPLGVPYGGKAKRKILLLWQSKRKINVYKILQGCRLVTTRNKPAAERFENLFFLYSDVKFQIFIYQHFDKTATILIGFLLANHMLILSMMGVFDFFPGFGWIWMLIPTTFIFGQSAYWFHLSLHRRNWLWEKRKKWSIVKK